MLRVHFIPKKQANERPWIDAIYGETTQMEKCFTMEDPDGQTLSVMGVFVHKGVRVFKESDGWFVLEEDLRCGHFTILVAIQDSFWKTVGIILHELCHFVNFILFHGTTMYGILNDLLDLPGMTYWGRIKRVLKRSLKRR